MVIATPRPPGLKAQGYSAADRRTIAELARKGFPSLDFIQLFDRVPVAGFWIKDAKGRFVWVNTAFVLHNGLSSRAEILGKTDFDLCSPALAAQYALDDRTVLKGASITSRIEMVGRYDHAMTWVVTSKIPVRDRRGRVIGTCGVSYTYPGKDSDIPGEAPLAGAMRRISENLQDGLNPAELARFAGMSVRDFHRKFRATYGVSPRDYVRNLRVRASCNALVFSGKPLASVATEFGFADQSHFAREFRRVVGEPPSSYRARFQR